MAAWHEYEADAAAAKADQSHFAHTANLVQECVLKLDRMRIDVGQETLVADRLAALGLIDCLVLHGAGTSHRQRWLPLRKRLADHGISSLAIDFSGHGESSSLTPGSLAKRYTEAASALSRMGSRTSRIVIGVSMSGEIAARLACERLGKADHLITVVGAASDAQAYAVPFGPGFSQLIRRKDSWQDSVVFQHIRQFEGAVTVICADADEVVPRAVGERLLENAVRARSRQMLRVKNATHRMAEMVYLPPPFHDGLAGSLAFHMHRATTDAPLIDDDLCCAFRYPVAGANR